MTDKSAFKISDYFWPLGVGMLTGWVCLYLFLVYVLTHGGKIQGWHAGVWVLATYLGTWIALQGVRTEAEDRSTESIPHLASGLWHRIRISGALTCLALILPLIFSWVLGHFTDFSWDGMTSRGITVRNLMKGGPVAQYLPFWARSGWVPVPCQRQLAGRQGDQFDPHMDLFQFYFSDATASQLFRLAAVVSIHGHGAKPCCGVSDLLLPDRWPRGLTHHLPAFFNVKNSGVGTHPTGWSAGASGSFRGICFQQNLGRILCHYHRRNFSPFCRRNQPKLEKSHLSFWGRTRRQLAVGSLYPFDRAIRPDRFKVFRNIDEN